MLTTAQEWRQGELRFSTALNTCLVILERSEESRQKMQELNVILYEQKQKIPKWLVPKSRPRLSGKVAAIAVGRGKCEQKQKNENKCEKKGKKISYRSI